MTHNNLAEESNTNNRPPLFNGSNYSSWKNPMKYHIISKGVEYWKIIIFSPQAPLKENEIINGIGNLGKHMTDSEKVKKILRSLPKEWDSQVIPIMKSKDLNHLEFNALVRSLINYEIILKSRGGRGKSQKSIALKANVSSLDESDEEIDEEEEDEELAMYARNLRKFKGLLKNRRKELRGGRNEEIKKYTMEREHHVRECKSSSFISNFQKNDKYDKGKKKASLVATWSDDEEAYQSNDENNLALMENRSLPSDDEDEVTFIDQDLRDSFNALQIDFEEAIEINKRLRKKIRDLVAENNVLHETIDDLYCSKEDHSTCLAEKENLTCELDRLRKEFSYVVEKFAGGNE
ncbi:hypothetical protein K2173_003345 [Erythroxylum novogranatense]|uniref:DUF4219 domain-containing protein n=1 Tax=Erythroxylum novogranatense TaxID=1862640 RepID=A0AAV8S8F9_9ROSI|nr:hypothetical protein K2173_003345 [Erythroxylum novogranatense]